jgi:hypothetical protein
VCAHVLDADRAHAPTRSNLRTRATPVKPKPRTAPGDPDRSPTPRPSLCLRRAPVRSSPRVNGAVTLYYSPWKKPTPFMAAMKHPTTSALPPSLYKTRVEPFSSPSHSRTPFSTPSSPSRSRSPHSRARRRPNRSSPSSLEFVEPRRSSCSPSTFSAGALPSVQHPVTVTTPLAVVPRHPNAHRQPCPFFAHQDRRSSQG